LSVHLIKCAVGVADAGHLRRLQERRLADVAGRRVVFGWTRRRPRRVEEVLAGGSIYWIVKGLVQVRQRVLDLEEAVDDEGLVYCRMHLDPLLVATEPTPRRAIQGWRYLAPADAPPDLGAGGQAGEGLPPEMARELRLLGIL
jgi:hypothetical protein